MICRLFRLGSEDGAILMQDTTVVGNGNPVWIVLKLQTGLIIIPPLCPFRTLKNLADSQEVSLSLLYAFYDRFYKISK